MALFITNAEDAPCAFLKDPSVREKHTAQPHIQLSSLPNPNTPISITSFPIEVRSETSIFSPRNVANLWTQLLSIHIQNGNFWKYKDAMALHNEKARVPILSHDEKEKNAQEARHKEVLFLRHRLQKGLLSKDVPPAQDKLPETSMFLSKLEDFGDLDATSIHITKIHKVCKAISKLDNIPDDSTYHFKARSAALLYRYKKALELEQQNPQLPSIPLLSVPSDVEIEPESKANIETDEFNELPALCLTQLTPDQCKRVEDAAAACHPPLCRGVVELMCMLPQLTSNYGGLRVSDLQIAPLAKLVKSFNDFPKIDRVVYNSGPIIPPHMLQLTSGISLGNGVALFVDTQTGEGLQLERFGPFESGIVCTEFEGKRRPIEELLQEWIDYSLDLKFTPSGDEYFISDTSRSMDYLRQKFLLQEYGWPITFPLSPSDYGFLIQRQAELYKERLDRWDTNPTLHRSWNDALCNFILPSKFENEAEKVKILDQRIRQALDWHERKIEDRKYALAADVPLDKSYQGPLVLAPSCNTGGNWRVDVTPDMIMERFNEVVGEDRPNAKEMRKVLEDAYERWKLVEKGIHVLDFVDELDDDTTSDYEPSEEECDEDEEWESDEEDENLDFDVAILEEDRRMDIEEIRRTLEGYQIREV